MLIQSIRKKRKNRLTVYGLWFTVMKNRTPYTVDRRSSIGFTLVELMLVCALLAVVSLAVYSVFSSGIRIWQSVLRQTPYEDLNVFFDKLAGDLRNTFNYKGIGFSGETDKFSFATLVNSQRLDSQTVGKVIYAYNRLDESLSREERDYSHVYSDDAGFVTEMMKNISSLKFSYYEYDDEMDKYMWHDSWAIEDETIPLALRVELEYYDDRNTIELTRTIDIPAGQK